MRLRGFAPVIVRTLAPRPEEPRSGVSKDEADIGGLMVLLAMRSIVQ